MRDIKTKILYNGNPVILNKEIQNFIKDKEIIDIKFAGRRSLNNI